MQRVRVSAAIVAVGALLWWAGRSLAPRLLSIVAHIQGLGSAAPITFILIYAFAVVALIPASLLTIAGGAVFGLIRGVIYALIGATLGSTAAFLLGRYAARHLVTKRLAAMPRFVAIERAVTRWSPDQRVGVVTIAEALEPLTGYTAPFSNVWLPVVRGQSAE